MQRYPDGTVRGMNSLLIIGLSGDLSLIIEAISGLTPSDMSITHGSAFYAGLNGFMLLQAKNQEKE